jgi:Ca-activated chloride channel homolog
MNRLSIYSLLRARRFTLSLLILLFLLPLAYSQTELKLIRQGNREYKDGKFVESETKYREATDKNQKNTIAVFNTGDALYKQNKFEDAGKLFTGNSEMFADKSKKAASLYNLGNSLLMADKPAESIDAYKEALKLDPSSMEAKYNLAYAQDLLRQEQEDKQNKEDNKDQDNEQKENKEQENKDNPDKKDDQDQNKENGQSQAGQQKISREDAERVLNALANQEKNIQEKVKLAKAKEARVRTSKNW